jgi:hypothetical protein
MGSSIISVLSSTEGAGSPANMGVVQTSFAGEQPWKSQRPRLACSIRALGGPIFSGVKGELGAAFTGGGGGAGGLHTAPMRGISQEALLGQGFGVISEIDVRSTFETKLGEENGQALGGYLILGVCNPALAQRALGGRARSRLSGQEGCARCPHRSAFPAVAALWLAPCLLPTRRAGRPLRKPGDLPASSHATSG